MSISSNLRESNTRAHKDYMNARMNEYNTYFRDGHPGLINPLEVPDNSITMLVETGTFVDNEHPDQPAQNSYATTKLTHIGIRYLEVADDKLTLTVGEVNGGVFNGYTRAPMSHDRPDPSLIVYECSRIGGTWNTAKKTWVLQNVEIPIVGSLTTNHSTRAWYQLRPYHDYGYFVNLVMNDWDNSLNSGVVAFLDWRTNYVTEIAVDRSFPTTKYAPVRDIIVNGSRMEVINLNCMQYLYYAYISGYVTTKNYKIAGCPVLKVIGSVGSYGARVPAKDGATAGIGFFSFAHNPSMTSCPGIGESFTLLNPSNMFKNSKALDRAPWIDMKTAQNGGSVFTNSYIRFGLPDYDYSSMIDSGAMYRSCPNLPSVPPLNMPKLTTAVGMFQECFAVTSISITAPLLKDMRNFANLCKKMTTFSLLGGARPTNLNSAFMGTTVLRTINLFDTSLCTNIYNAFNGSGLTTLPAFNFANVTDAGATFRDSKIATFPALNFSKCTSLFYAFSGTPITAVPAITTTAALTRSGNAFYNCAKLVGNFDNYADTTPATHPNFNTTGVTDASGMFSRCVGLTRIEINLPKATTVQEICYGCTALTTANVRLTDGVVTNTRSMYEGATKARWNDLSVTGYTSALKIATKMYKNIDWNTADNTGTVFLNLPAVTEAQEMLYGVHGRVWIKLQNLSNISSTSMDGFFGRSSSYTYNQYPARKLWILNRTCGAVFGAWKELNNAASLANARFEITLESVSGFDPIWLNGMNRMTKLTFINEPLDFQATAGLWVAAHNFQTNAALTEINLQGSVTPEFVKALQVVAPVTVNYTGSITILHHNDLAWT